MSVRRYFLSAGSSDDGFARRSTEVSSSVCFVSDKTVRLVTDETATLVRKVVFQILHCRTLPLLYLQGKAEFLMRVNLRETRSTAGWSSHLCIAASMVMAGDRG